MAAEKCNVTARIRQFDFGVYRDVVVAKKRHIWHNKSPLVGASFYFSPPTGQKQNQFRINFIMNVTLHVNRRFISRLLC